MTTPRPGRFTEAATTAQTRPPIGASRREGWAGLALAGVEGVSLAVMFQAHNLPWGGIVLWATLCLMQVGILVVSVWASRERGVHRRGFRRDVLLAGGWLLLWATPCGWFWDRSRASLDGRVPHNCRCDSHSPSAGVGLRPAGT